MAASRPLCLALLVIGLAVSVYGTSTLTGGWLGTPPWWERAAPLSTLEWIDRYRPNAPMWLLKDEVFRGGDVEAEAARLAPLHKEPSPDRELISGAIIAVGAGLAAWGAWPRRRSPAA